MTVSWHHVLDKSLFPLVPYNVFRREDYKYSKLLLSITASATVGFNTADFFPLYNTSNEKIITTEHHHVQPWAYWITLEALEEGMCCSQREKKKDFRLWITPLAAYSTFTPAEEALGGMCVCESEEKVFQKVLKSISEELWKIFITSSWLISILHSQTCYI